MTVEITGIHNYHVSDNTKEHIEDKLTRLEHFDELIQDLKITLTKETNHEYKVAADLHLKWGFIGHLDVKDRDLYKGIDMLVDKLDLKIIKEKEKIKTH
ncbi:MAG: ribosome-associated translation inhibitor RaiA [Spirochaetaceae bacterium]|jgi:putative sigma-54 modulation protein|nr:ribosome-associated translation inhibitor RaiA [Spirochaetaceae bacterium]